MVEKNEGALAGKYPDMGIKTIEGQDNEGKLLGTRQQKEGEPTAQELRQHEDESELNKKDAREDARDPGRVWKIFKKD